MKKIFTAFLPFLLWAGVVSGQHSCCQPNNQSLAFNAMGSNPAFIIAHAEPLPTDFQPSFGKMIELKSLDGRAARAFEAKSGSASGKVILMFHEWWGLNAYIMQEAEKIAKATGATVLALDLYDGRLTEDRGEAAKLSAAVNSERAFAIIRAGLNYAGKTGKVQTIGWCFGGGWSLQAAIEGADKVVGCVIYYGMPESDPARIEKLSAPVLGIFGVNDDFINPQIVGKFQSDMTAAGKSLEIQNYEAVHAFANPSNPDYNKEATEDAMNRTITFLKNNFKAAKTHK